MSATRFLRTLGLASAVAAVGSIANANIYLSLGNGSDPDAASTIQVTRFNDNFNLGVWVIVTDPAPSMTMPQFQQVNASFETTGSVLKGDVSAGTFNGAVTNPIDVQSGVQFTNTGNSTLALGGTSATDGPLDWWLASNVQYNSPANTPAGSGFFFNSSGTLSSPTGAEGYEWYVGTINVNFDNYKSTWGSAGTTVTCPIVSGVRNGTRPDKPYNFFQSNFSGGGTNGNSSLVGAGTGGNDLLYQPVTFSYTPYIIDNGVLAASLGISGATTGLGGTSLALTGAVSNVGVAPAYAITWDSATTPAMPATFAPASGTGLATGAPTPLTGSLALPAAYFGPVHSVVAFTGTDMNGTDSTPVVQTLNATIIGKTTVGGAAVTTMGNVPIAGLMSTTGTAADTYGIGSTSADMLAGSASGTVTESYRARSTHEMPATAAWLGGVPAGDYPLYSDVIRVTGATGVREMQVTYDPAELGGTTAAAAAASSGSLFLGYNNTAGTLSGKGNGWVPAFSTSTAGADAVSNYQGSYASFTAGAGNGFTLSQLLGSYGVDTASNTVWAIVSTGDGQFAAVPEPGTIGLLLAGVAGFGYAYRRRPCCGRFLARP